MATMEKSDNVRATTHDLADRALDAGVRAADSLGRAADRMKETGDRLAYQTNELSENVGQVAGNFANAIDKSVAEKPMTTLGMAVAFGFLLGALWKA